MREEIIPPETERGGLSQGEGAGPHGWGRNESDEGCWNCEPDVLGPSLLTVEEAAALCGVSTASVYRWMERDRVEWLYHAGGRRRVCRDSLFRISTGRETA
jgi:hypothetical protein